MKYTGIAEKTEKRIAVITAKFNYPITKSLTDAAIDTFLEYGMDESAFDLFQVPGAFEIPYTLKKILKTGKYFGVVALGAVIRGETPHFDYVAGEASRGISRLSLDFEVPVAFGLLTTDTVDQAWARAGIKGGNKGSEAAKVLLEMMNLGQQIDQI